MKLIIDANVVISAIISSEGKTCDLLFSDKFILIAPEYLLEELKKHSKEITEKSCLTKDEFTLALSLISSRIMFLPFNEFEQFIPKAKETCPDQDDIEYFAIALKFDCPIWSNDKKLKEQNLIIIYSTQELLRMFD